MGRKLSQSMQEKGNEIRTFMPRYGIINERRHQLHEVIRLSGMNLIIDDTDHQLIIKVASIPAARMQVYFIDNEDYFSRKAMLHDENGELFADNDERAIFYSRGVLETVKKLRWTPSIVHSHGWFASIAPLYLKHVYSDDPVFKDVKIVVTVDNEDFEGSLDQNFINKIKGEGINDENIEILSNPTYENFWKFVLKYADGIVIGDEQINDNVREAILATGKPTLEYIAPDADEFSEKYNQFYDSL